MSKERVDALTYKQELFGIREQAECGAMAGLVVNMINGEHRNKSSEKIDDGMELKLKGEKLEYVSRDRLKLEKALQVFEISVDGQMAIDIDTLTSGLTDVMLQNGAKLVYVADAGTNQSAWRLHQSERVRSMEQYNLRYAELANFTEGQPAFAGIGVSSVSLNLILPVLHNILADNGQVVAPIKPQLEAGHGQIGRNGIVRDRVVYRKVLENVTDFALNYGFTVEGLDFSSIQDGHSNTEFLAYLEKSADVQNLVTVMIPKTVEKTHKEFKDEKE